MPKPYEDLARSCYTEFFDGDSWDNMHESGKKQWFEIAERLHARFIRPVMMDKIVEFGEFQTLIERVNELESALMWAKIDIESARDKIYDLESRIP